MAIHIQTGKKALSTNKSKSRIQSLPFKILADCDAKVTDLFDSNVKIDEDKNLKNSFRGRPLNGQDIQLPEGYIGVILHESITPRCDKEERKFHITDTFQTIRYWNWDKKPSKNDMIIQAIDWIDIAKALHSPIEEIEENQ